MDYDFAVIGSGFGGSVSALRLSEKGYRVAVLEQGKRWTKDDFAKTSWDLRKFFWEPRLGLHGIMQMTQMRDVFFLHGAGVGGGSLVYANTLLQPPAEAFRDPQWVGQDWEKALLPHYETAKRMLGAVPSACVVETDRLLKKVADDMGRGHTWHRANVGVYFGEAGRTVSDPFFDGAGPERTGCTMCGGCMIGCRVGAKNSLDYNYLYLAERMGARVYPESRVTDVRALSKDEGGGYELTIAKSTGCATRISKMRVKGVVASAGSFGTVDLLMRSKERGSLPRISGQLGDYLRTNSEAILAVRSRQTDVDHSKGIAITSGVYVDDRTHVEVRPLPGGVGHDGHAGDGPHRRRAGFSAVDALGEERGAPAARVREDAESGRVGERRGDSSRDAARGQPHAVRDAPQAGSRLGRRSSTATAGRTNRRRRTSRSRTRWRSGWPRRWTGFRRAGSSKCS